MKNSNSGNLSKGDIISFVALLILGIIVFFGINFMTLGDKIVSVVVAILLFVVMAVFVFLAAHAKAQDRNQSTWKKVEFAMLGLYVIALVPCYIYSAKFFDIQLGKKDIMQQVQSYIDDIDKMFADYTIKSKSRSDNYKTELEALLKYDEGRERIVRLLKLDVYRDDLTPKDIESATKSFEKNLLKNSDINSLKAEKNTLVEICNTNFKNWNIVLIPQYVLELSEANVKYASKLEKIFTEHKSPFEKDEPKFETSEYIKESNIVDNFKSSSDFSILGLIAIIVLGGLGLVKYIFGEKSTAKPMDIRNDTVITEDGGFTFK